MLFPSVKKSRGSQIDFHFCQIENSNFFRPGWDNTYLVTTVFISIYDFHIFHTHVNICVTPITFAKYV